jgi:hypothetical protein
MKTGWLCFVDGKRFWIPTEPMPFESRVNDLDRVYALLPVGTDPKTDCYWIEDIESDEAKAIMASHGYHT